MKVFAFDPADHRAHYAQHGWAHIKSGVDPEFLEYLRGFAQQQFDSHHVSGRGIGGSKEQAVFEFPEGVDIREHVGAPIAAVAGLNAATMTVSERHIKAYDDDAPEDPPAHKDRLSSQVSVGLSIAIPEGSHLVLYPDDDRGANPFNVSAEFRDSLTEEELPENRLKGAREEVIHDESGDVTLFEGSAMWHKRRNAANAVNLYLKFNDFGSDPLGEDPDTERRRAATLAALNGKPLTELVVEPARRLDTITRRVTRDPGREVIQADVWGTTPVTLDDREAQFLESLAAGRTVGDLGVDEELVRRLAQRGVIDLLGAGR